MSIQRIFRGTVELVDGSESEIWKRFLIDNGHGAPFWLHISENAGMSVAAETVFMTTAGSVPSLDEDPPIFFQASFDFQEAF